MIGKNQTHQTKVVVPVQMADKNMVDAVGFNTIAQHLHLGGLTAVNEKKILIAVEQLRGMVPAKGKRCRIAA
jgi:hypothetical protein